ncbi:uncharacterized protein [Pocillopora verrucosa]|uniref:uncharacterized protein n=1 Tax=Pocillopora verrucosa TaxID=203993 RepID=UPI00333E5E12
MKRKIIIDSEAGIDDAQAIMIALSQEVDVLAITCTCGNVTVDQVTKNVLKVLEACERTDIPLYQGAYRSLLVWLRPILTKFPGIAYEQPLYHGFDGLGDATDITDPDTSLLQQPHAAQALVQLVNENPGEIVIIALGPLTNIALASNFDAEFTKKVKEVALCAADLHLQCLVKKKPHVQCYQWHSGWCLEMLDLRDGKELAS